MLLLKPGVRIDGLRPEILIAVVIAERVCAEMGVDCVVTACVDGAHQAGSLHYCGLAVDLRSRDFRPGDGDTEWTAVDTAATEAKAREFLRSRFESC